MSRLGHTTHKYYKETRGIKVSGGQEVKAGTVLTRQGHKWKPGINVAFDPIAVKLGRELGTTVVITGGRDLDNVTKIIAGEEFKGTVITAK